MPPLGLRTPLQKDDSCNKMLAFDASSVMLIVGRAKRLGLGLVGADEIRGVRGRVFGKTVQRKVDWYMLTDLDWCSAERKGGVGLTSSE